MVINSRATLVAFDVTKRFLGRADGVFAVGVSLL